MLTTTPPSRRRVASAHVAALAALIASATPLRAQTITIGTGAPPAYPEPPSYAALLGTSGPLPSLAVGQSFTVPTGVTSLDAMQLGVRNDPHAVLGYDFRLLTYRLFVAAFDSVGRQVVGAPVFVSASRAGFADVTPNATAFSTGGVAVLPGALYVAFLVPDEPVPPFLPLAPHQGEAVGFAGDAYGGGRAYTLQYYGGRDPGPLAAAWQAQDADFAFSATFAAVPEPTTWALVGAGLAATGALATARRRRAG